jgi:hypothetical protein
VDLSIAMLVHQRVNLNIILSWDLKKVMLGHSLAYISQDCKAPKMSLFFDP